VQRAKNGTPRFDQNQTVWCGVCVGGVVCVTNILNVLPVFRRTHRVRRAVCICRRRQCVEINRLSGGTRMNGASIENEYRGAAATAGVQNDVCRAAEVAVTSYIRVLC